MVNTFVNPRINYASQLGFNFFEDTEPILLSDGASEDELETVIRAVYRQVLGNIHVMESERLTAQEAQLKSGDIRIRDFVRCVALSELYCSRFFHNCPQNRVIELNFKHLLGRAPESHEEISEHIEILAQEGYEAEVNSYLDSQEYQTAFGDDIVPYYRGHKTQIGKKVVGFSHMLKLMRGSPTSDLSIMTGNQSRLQNVLMRNLPSGREGLFKVTPEWRTTIRKPATIKKTTFMPPVSTKIPSTAAPLAAPLGVNFFENPEPVILWTDASEEDIEIVINAVYRQVLGNIHVMESERLTIAESQLKNGQIGVRGFIRLVTYSQLYRSRFFDNCPPVRAIELNFKHLLGRAPNSYEEISEHIEILTKQGYEAEINSYLDSQEYQEAFGEDIVPYYQGGKTQTGKSVVGFTHMLKLLRCYASSDLSAKTGNKSRLQYAIMKNIPSQREFLFNTFPLWKPISSTVSQTAESVQKIDPEQLALQNQYQAFEDLAPTELLPDVSASDVEVVIRAVYRQVLGNAHVMESERLTVPESQLKGGEISVREFVRYVAKSELYRSKFFDPCPRYRSIELNFKHLLGRAPADYSETFYHSSVLDQEGFEAEIDSYLDSDEYQDNFGEDIVPFNRGYKTQTGQNLLGFTNMFKLLKSVSTSDKAGLTGNKSRLSKSLIYNNVSGEAPVTDINALIAEVLKPKPWMMGKTTVAPSEGMPSEVEAQLQSQCDEQEKLIETLQQQLADLRPFASIGISQLSKGSAYSSATNGGSGATSYSQSSSLPANSQEALSKKSAEQQEIITSLEAQIADARRFATIGEARLNKWRSRSFS